MGSDRGIGRKKRLNNRIFILSVGGYSQIGLPVASAGPTGSGGHAGAEGTQRVSASQHPSCTRHSPFSGQEQER